MADTVTTQVKRVSHMTLIISDQDNARDFYERAFGTEVRGDQVFEYEGQRMRWLTVGLPGDGLEWVLMPPVPSPDGTVPKVGDNTMTVLEVSDCDAVAERARAAGGGVVTEPEDMPWGRSAVVRDPDGNPWNLVTPAI